jgi:hypothetical protein
MPLATSEQMWVMKREFQLLTSDYLFLIGYMHDLCLSASRLHMISGYLTSSFLSSAAYKVKLSTKECHAQHSLSTISQIVIAPMNKT